MRARNERPRASKAKRPADVEAACAEFRARGNGELPTYAQKREDAMKAGVAAKVNGGAPAARAAARIPAGFIVSENGVFYKDDDRETHRICSPLYVTALVRDDRSENWGRVLEWCDADGVEHVWAMPMELLSGEGVDMRGELARLGLELAPGFRARIKLMEYVTYSRPTQRARCVSRTGWYRGVFVLPDRTIGESHERLIFQSDTHQRSYAQAGTLAQWQANVAAYCEGNSRLLLAVSAAFAAMLLHLVEQESGGLNLVGASSTGKTTALRVASSVFGGVDYLQRWRATANGIEALAAVHNDALLVLDELAQVDPREAGEIAYMLANGSGKARAARTGLARSRQSWRVLFLSAGEIGLAQHMRDGGKRAKAGQEVRLVDVPADAGAGYGVFECLHGMDGGSALCARLNENAAAYYGTAALAFLEAAARDQRQLPDSLRDGMRRFVADNLPANAGGQAQRVCQRFALIALAGEYATKSGVTGWPERVAYDAAARCFADWLESRGSAGNQERAAMLSQVKAFFEAHEESRFANIDAMDERPTINRAGFRRSGESGVEYLVLPEVYGREICAGFEPRAVSKALIEAGWIRPAQDGRSQRTERIPCKGPTKVYVFTSALWEHAP
jgi:putative DNA primase/helicase